MSFNSLKIQNSKPLFRVLIEQLSNKIGRILAKFLRYLVFDLRYIFKCTQLAIALKGGSSNQHLEEYNSERPKVCCVGMRFVTQNLRAHATSGRV